jgi:hypothetical protein
MKTRPAPVLFVLAAVLTVGCDSHKPSAEPSSPPPDRRQPTVARAQETPMSNPPPPPSSSASPSPASQPAPGEFTGTLRGGVLAIGAETTGWALETDDRRRIDIDVSRAADAAAKLDGQRVVIHGTIGQAKWLERGAKPLIIADRIDPAR